MILWLYQYPFIKNAGLNSLSFRCSVMKPQYLLPAVERSAKFTCCCNESSSMGRNINIKRQKTRLICGRVNMESIHRGRNSNKGKNPYRVF